VNIEVALTGSDELHCFKLTFQARISPDSEERAPLVVYLHTSQAIELHHQLGAKISEYFYAASSELLDIRARALQE
jgi:hypothetical protein